MSGTLGFLDIIDAHGGTITTPALDVIINGTSAAMPVFTLWGSGTGLSPYPVTDALSLAKLDTLITNQGVVAPLAYTINAAGTIGVSAGTLIPAGFATKRLVIASDPNAANTGWLNPTGGTPVIGAGIPLAGGGGSVIFGTEDLPMPSGAVTAIADGGTPLVVSLSGG